MTSDSPSPVTCLKHLSGTADWLRKIPGADMLCPCKRKSEGNLSSKEWNSICCNELPLWPSLLLQTWYNVDLVGWKWIILWGIFYRWLAIFFLIKTSKSWVWRVSRMRCERKSRILDQSQWIIPKMLAMNDYNSSHFEEHTQKPAVAMKISYP